jgi:superfamily I DNA and/or RNA helicase
MRNEIGTSYWNRVEADIIEEILQRIDRIWQSTQAGQRKEVGVITFYAAQLRKLDQRLKKRSPEQEFKHLNIRLGTVDRFQGMERPIVIVSLVRNNSDGDVGFAKEPERVNVAFSRAQELLIIVGSRELFCDQAKNTSAARIYKNVADIVRQSGGFIDVSTFQ